MSTAHKIKHKPFTVVGNDYINDVRLDCEQVGFLTRVFSFANLNLTFDHLARRCFPNVAAATARDKMSKMCRDLQQLGYCRVAKTRVNGRINFERFFYETKQPPHSETPHRENHCMAEPQSEIPHSENHYVEHHTVEHHTVKTTVCPTYIDTSNVDTNNIDNIIQDILQITRESTRTRTCEEDFKKDNKGLQSERTTPPPPPTPAAPSNLPHPELPKGHWLNSAFVGEGGYENFTEKVKEIIGTVWHLQEAVRDGLFDYGGFYRRCETRFTQQRHHKGDGIDGLYYLVDFPRYAVSYFLQNPKQAEEFIIKPNKKTLNNGSDKKFSFKNLRNEQPQH